MFSSCRLGQKAVRTWFVESAEGAWEITVPYGLNYNGLEPVPFIGFEISPLPSRASVQELRNQGWLHILLTSLTKCHTVSMSDEALLVINRPRYTGL